MQCTARPSKGDYDSEDEEDEYVQIMALSDHEDPPCWTTHKWS